MSAFLHPIALVDSCPAVLFRGIHNLLGRVSTKAYLQRLCDLCARHLLDKVAWIYPKLDFRLAVGVMEVG